VFRPSQVIVGAVTGPLATPGSLLLGRYDDDGRLQYPGRWSLFRVALLRGRRSL
jgi:hypothetical protein